MIMKKTIKRRLDNYESNSNTEKDFGKRKKPPFINDNKESQNLGELDKEEPIIEKNKK